jgi:hypothetical protein
LISHSLLSFSSNKDTINTSKYGTFGMSILANQSYLFNKVQTPRFLTKDEFKLNPQFGAGLCFYTKQIPLELSVQFSFGSYFRYRQGGRYNTFEHGFIKGVEHTQTGQIFRWNYSIGYIFNLKKGQLLVGLTHSRLRANINYSNRLDILLDNSIVIVDEENHPTKNYFGFKTRLTTLGLNLKYIFDLDKNITPYVLFSISTVKTKDTFISGDQQSYLNKNMAGICLGMNIKMHKKMEFKN